MSGSFRFIHAADIHLDSPLRGLSAYEGMPADVLRSAPREAFVNLVDAAISEKVDFLVIAGDLTDGDWPDYGTGLFMAAQYGRLQKANIAVYQLRGNHDAEGDATKSVTWPENVHEFSAKKPERFLIEHLNVALVGQSFPFRDVKDNLAAHYPAPVDGCFNIAVLHTALEGGDTEHPNYAPCTVAELRSSGHHYWALGHVHRERVVSTDPYIVYPGNLQGRNIREEGAKGAYLIEVGVNQEVVSAERLILDTLRWKKVIVDVSSAETTDEVSQLVRSQIQQVASAHGESMPLAIRLEIAGASPADAAIRAKGGALRADVQAIAAAASEKLWLEKVKVMTSPKEEHVEDLELGADAIGELREIFEDAATNPDFRACLEASIGADMRKVLAQVQSECEELALVHSGNYEPLIRNAAVAVLSRLSAPKP